MSKTKNTNKGGARVNNRLIRNPTVVNGLVVGAAAIVAALIALLGPSFYNRWFDGGQHPENQVSVRVADAQGTSVSGAKALLFFRGGPLSDYTDANGVVKFDVTDPTISGYKLIVEADGYDAYESNIDPARDGSISVQLSEPSDETKNIFVRVVDDKTSRPVEGIQVQLFVNGENYTEATDANGITKFALALSAEGAIDVEISVIGENYAVNNQQLTLQPNSMQDIRLNAVANTASVAPIQLAAVQEPASSPIGNAQQEQPIQARRVPCADQLSFGQTVECTVASATDVNTHTFSVARSDVVVFTAVRVGDLVEPSVVVYDAQEKNFPICQAAENLIAQVECRFQEAGTYNVDVQDRRQLNAGTYLLSLQRRNNPGNAVPLEFGKPLLDVVQDVAQRNTYTFSVGQGDKVLITVAKTADQLQPSFQVYNPDGEGVGACGGDDSLFIEVVCTFGNAGTYSIHVVDRGRINSGQYTIHVQRINRPDNAELLDIGHATAGYVTNIAQTNTYVFDTGSDQNVNISVTNKAGEVEPAFAVYDPDGRQMQLCSSSGAEVAEITCELRSLGEYVIFITDRSRINTGKYEILVTEVE